MPHRSGEPDLSPSEINRRLIDPRDILPGRFSISSSSLAERGLSCPRAMASYQALRLKPNRSWHSASDFPPS